MWRGLTSFPPVYWYFWTWTCCQVISQIVTKCSPNRCDLLANINTYVLLNCCFYSPKNICHGVWWLHMLNRFILYPNLNHWPNKTLAYQIEYATIQFLFFFLIFPFFFFHFRQHERRREAEGEREAGPLLGREPDIGLSPRTQKSWPKPKADEPSEPPRHPLSVLFLFCFYFFCFPFCQFPGS